VLQGDYQGVLALKSILDEFAALSGLHINYAKSTLVPIHKEETLVTQCVQSIGCKREGFPQPHLGLPLSLHKLPLSAYSPYIQKPDRYLSTWQAHLLNKMGRAVLVNSVLDSQLVYFMSSLQLPPAVIKQMDGKRRAFLWSGDKSGKASPASCLVAWTTVCKPKDLGGLGLKDIGIQNICLLLKLLHRVHCPQSSAWAIWVRGRACLANLKGEVHGGHWETLRTLLPLYQAITTVQLGDGLSCSFWMDVWFADDALADVYPALFSHCTNREASVSEVLEHGLHSDLVPRLSTQAAWELLRVQEIIAGASLSDQPDRRRSPFIKHNDCFDSGAIYHLLKARGQPADARATFVWRSVAPPRVQMFMWLLTQRRIQCRTVLQRKNILPDATCEVCNELDESPEHIMGGCTISRELWERLGLTEMTTTALTDIHHLNPPAGIPSTEFLAFLALACWQLWKTRNAAIFRNEMHNLDQVLLACKASAEQWRCRLPVRKRHIVDQWCLAFEMARY
jgi:hypothetical protein